MVLNHGYPDKSGIHILTKAEHFCVLLPVNENLDGHFYIFFFLNGLTCRRSEATYGLTVLVVDVTAAAKLLKDIKTKQNQICN